MLGRILLLLLRRLLGVALAEPRGQGAQLRGLLQACHEGIDERNLAVPGTLLLLLLLHALGVQIALGSIVHPGSIQALEVLQPRGLREAPSG